MTSPLSIRLLGGFGVEAGGVAVDDGAWRLRKAKSLVKLLALAPEHALHRERVLELLWPDRDPASAANNLHQALYVARRAVGSAGVDGAESLPMRGEVVLLSPDTPPWVDVLAFEAAATEARAARAPKAHRAALDLYGGELLPEDRFEDWATARRDALRELRLALLIELAELHAERAEHAPAIEALHQAVVEDPLHEAAQRALMRAFAADGRPQQALSQYERLRAGLRTAYEADPDPETRRLYRELLAGGAADDGVGAPAPSTAAAHNLPLRTTSFIGREREQAAVAARLDRTRLLTLTGPGGCGKTRLALEVATERLGSHGDGTWLVELASLSEPALVVQAVADAVDVQLRTAATPAAALAAQLRERALLLVLDNCEHLVGASAQLAGEVLRTCPGVVILATSREPLQVDGEMVWRVPSLALPDRGEAPSPAELLRYPSIRLFVERATDAEPDFMLDEANAAAVVDVCHRLDGMPLAIELAAARAGVLSPLQIAERLSDALAVLTSGSRAGPTRRQTLRATLEWSHDLLTDDERRLFRRLAVFAGTFGLPAAEQVCAGDGIAERDVLDLVGRLTDKSLVAVEAHEREHRYRLLEVIRQYARERLEESGEPPVLEARHRTWYLGLVERADPELATGPAAEEWPERLEVEHDNLRAALGTALADDPETAQRLAASMWRFWLARGYFVEGARWIEAALERGPRTGPLRSRVLSGACAMGVRCGDQTRTTEMAEEAVAIFRNAGDLAATVGAMNLAATMAWARGEHDRAEAHCVEGIALAQEIAAPTGVATLTHTLGLVAYTRGDDEAARRRFEEAVTLLDQVPAEHPSFFPATAIGLVILVEGVLNRPRMLFEDTVFHFRRVGAPAASGYALANLATVLRTTGEHAAAGSVLEECDARFRRLEDPVGVPFALNQLGCLARSIGDFDRAREHLDEALALRRELGERRAVGMALGSLGLLDGRTGDLDRARTRLDQALRRFEASDDAPGVCGMLCNLGVVELDAGDIAAARAALERGCELWSRQRLPRAEAWSALMLADTVAAGPDSGESAALYEDATRRFEEFGDARGLAAVAAVAESPLRAR